MHADTATRQHWMSVLAHSQPAELAARLHALNIWVLGRDKQHAERCALIDALMQQTRHFQNLSETLIAPLDADRMARIAARQAEVNASRVDFFTMVRGDNA